MTTESSQAAALLGALGGKSGRGQAKSRSNQLRAYWARLTPAERAARGNLVKLAKRREKSCR